MSANQAPVVLAYQDAANFSQGRTLTVGPGLQLTDYGMQEPITITVEGNGKNLNALTTQGLIWSNARTSSSTPNTYVTKTFSTAGNVTFTDINNVINFNMVPSSSLQLVHVLNNGSSYGSDRSTLNFIPGSGINIVVSDNQQLNQKDIQISATGGGSGSGSITGVTAIAPLSGGGSTGVVSIGLPNTLSGLSNVISETEEDIILGSKANGTASALGIGSSVSVDNNLLNINGITALAAEDAGKVIAVKSGGGSFELINQASGGSNDFVVLGSSSTSQTISKNGEYVSTSSDLVTFALPISGIPAGSKFRIAGFGEGGWKITQNANQSIHFGNQNTTVGVGGYLASTNAKDAVEIVCVVANTTFSVISSIGNITII